MDNATNKDQPRCCSPPIRYRVNVKNSTKGVVTFDSTVEGEGFNQDEILERSDSLVQALQKRYPLVPEV
jgi:hypothetical protein